MTGRNGARAAGFSLLEVLVAMMVLSVGAASVLSLFAAAANTHRRAVDRTRAALVAERLFSEIQGRYTVGKTVTELRDELKKEVPERFGDYRWDAYVFRPATRAAGSFKRTRLASSDGDEEDRGVWEEEELFVRVLVRWKRSGHNRAESFFTILLPRNTPGATSAAPGTGAEKRTRRSGSPLRRRSSSSLRRK